jgi:hypothetical protein
MGPRSLTVSGEPVTSKGSVPMMSTARTPIVLPPALAPLVDQPRWVVWKWVAGKDGKRTKPPFQARDPHKHASSTDPATWCDFDSAMLAYCAGNADGIGYALNGGDIGAFDIDHCIDSATGDVHPWAQALVLRCGSYAEVTPSKTGIRILGWASGPELHRKFSVAKADGMSIEIYRRAERYITISGNQFGETAELVNMDAEIDTVAAKLDSGKQQKQSSSESKSKQHDLDALIKNGCGQDFGGDRSRALWYVIHQLLKRGDDFDQVVAIILDRGNRISDHVYDQPRPEDYARRQVEKAQLQQAAKAEADRGKHRPAKDSLIELAQDAELFHTPDGTAYADFMANGHRETWPIRSKGFRRWLGRSYYEQTQSAPNAEAMQAALGIIEARAHYDAPERSVSTRIAGLESRIYIDCCNNTWQAVEVDEDGWRILDEPPVRFRRANGMLPLPIPARGGDIKALRRYLNLNDSQQGMAESKFVLAVSVLLSYLRPRGPYPVLVLAGEQGACKSTFAAVIRALIDPNASALRALPREDRDLFIAAINGWLLAFDNVSTLPDWISDTLCRLSTGGGFATRQLYSDSDEILFDAMRPIILNGIEDFVGRPDLADRSVFLTLEPMPDLTRQSELEFWSAFEKDKPQILGAILDMVVHGLKYLPDVRLNRTPRMADFARWVVACEGAVWATGSFLRAYSANRQGAVETVLEADVVATTLREFMAQRIDAWTGTATELQKALNATAGEIITKAKEWPKTPKTLSGRLRRASSFLRQVGVRVEFDRSGISRAITITAHDANGACDADPFGRPQSQKSSEMGSEPLGPDKEGNFASSASSASRSQEFQADSCDARDAACVTPEPLKTNANDASDANDAKNPPFSGWDQEMAAGPDPDGWSFNLDDRP